MRRRFLRAAAAALLTAAALTLAAVAVGFLLPSSAPVVVPVNAATLNIPYTFSTGTPIYASQMNSNFTAIWNVVNALDDANVSNASITGSTKLIDLSVTLGKLAADSVNSSKIVDSSVAEADIGVPDDPANLRVGLMTGDRTHILKLFGTWEFYKNATLGFYTRLQSGRPWEARLQDYYGNYYRYAEKAGAKTLDTWINTDLQLAYVIPFGNRFSGTNEARFMNLFATQTVLGIDQRQDQPSFESATSYPSPRKFALSFYLNF